MVTPALQVVASIPALQKAWKRISAGKLSSSAASRLGEDGESLASFANRLESNLHRISKELRQKQYHFSSLEPFFIPKPNGKERLICVPTVADRVVQRAILDFLTPKNGGWLANGVSYGFVPDLGVPDAVKLSIQYRNKLPWVFKTDITAFFDRIDRSILSKKIHSDIKHRSLHPLMEMAIGCEIHAASSSQTTKLKKLDIRQGRGVRQGMPLSPFFANLMLLPFDRACQRSGYAAIRYADDIVFFSESQEASLAIQDFCHLELSKLNLQIPELGEESKSRVYAPEEAADFLGVELRRASPAGYELAISAQQLTEIKKRVYTYGNLEELKRRGLDVTKFGNALLSATSAYAATYAYCSNALDLKNRLDSWKRETLLRVFKPLGIQPEKLTPDQRWFLGVAG